MKTRSYPVNPEHFDITMGYQSPERHLLDWMLSGAILSAEEATPALAADFDETHHESDIAAKLAWLEIGRPEIVSRVCAGCGKREYTSTNTLVEMWRSADES